MGTYRVAVLWNFDGDFVPNEYGHLIEGMENSQKIKDWVKAAGLTWVPYSCNVRKDSVWCVDRQDPKPPWQVYRYFVFGSKRRAFDFKIKFGK